MTPHASCGSDDAYDRKVDGVFSWHIGQSFNAIVRLALPVSDVPLEISLGRRHLEHLVEPALKVLRRRRRAVDVHTATAETGTLQLEFDVVVFRVRVGNSHRLAFAQWEKAVPPVEHEDAIVFCVEVDLSATLEGGPEDHQDWPKLPPARQRHRWGDCER